MSEADIGRLRAELDKLDGELVAAMARRQAIVAEIGRRKQAVGRQLRDFAREKQVLEGVRARAQAQGLDPGLAEAVLKLLIEASLTAQEQDRVRAGRHGEGRRALVLGGAGRMGRWFVDFLDAQGFAVEVVDPVLAGASARSSGRTRLDEGSVDHELIVLATPLSHTAAALEELTALRPTGLVLELASLKSPLLHSLERADAAGIRVASIHPMFGPDTNLLAGRHVLLMQVGGQAAAIAEARALFSATSAEVVELPLAEHDRLIAYVLGLSHLVNLCFASALADSGDAAERLARLSSTTFDQQLAVASRVNAENPELYFEIQALNAHRELALAGMRQALEEWTTLVHAGDAHGFASRMARNRAWLAHR